MENMPRNQIEEIALSILNNGDIIAKHGTSIECAKSILETGFNYHRTSFVVQKTKDIEALCGYGWKDNKPGDSTNVIIQIPKQFIMDLFEMSDLDEYNRWIENIIDLDLSEDVLKLVTTIENFPSKKVGKFVTPPAFKAHIPQEFIVGAFIWCNGKTVLNIEEGESPLDNLSFVTNEKFYLNLSYEEQQEVVSKIKKKIGLEQEGKSIQ